MSTCPNCERKLRLIDWRPNCPGCGVNLMTFGFEKRFYEDAKRAELSLASSRARGARAKKSFSGNLTAKLRLYTCAAPLAALLLPMGTLAARLPFAEKQWSAGVLGIVNLVMKGMGDLPWLQTMLDSEQAALFRFGAMMLAASALAVVAGLLSLLCSVFTFISVKKMSGFAAAASILGALASAGGFVFGLLMRNSAQALDNTVYVGTLGYGAPLVFAVFVFVAVLNIRLAAKGVPVEYGEGDFERAELFKKVNKGEISLDDLPYPVVETAATREHEAKIQKEIGGAQA